MSLCRGTLRRAVPALLAVMPGVLSAQTTFATITGTVTDPAGAVVPGVTVRAIHNDTNTRTTAQSNEAGVYTLAQLKEGDYSLHAEGAGFKESVVQNVVLQARDYRRIDILLEVGGLETKVEVTAGATLIETETARISDTKDADLLKALPLNTRTRTWPFRRTCLARVSASPTGASREAAAIRETCLLTASALAPRMTAARSVRW